MRSPFSITRLCAFCVCLVFGLTVSAFAHWGLPGDSDSFASPTAESASKSADSDAAAEISEDNAEESEDDAEEIVKEEPAVEPVVEEAPAVEEVQVNAKPEKTREKARESNSAQKFRYGIRAALGVSAFSGHKAIYTESFGSHAISLGALASASTGLVFVAPVIKNLSVAWELQYSLYTAHGEFTLKTKDADFGNLNVAGVELHSFEMPVLANYTFGERVYAELGPQFGLNAYAKIYANDELKKPYLNRFAFGPALGAGVKLNDAAAIGVRGYFNVLEYAENTDGRPWTVQAGVTSFFKCK